jgi:copper(I)-binding protein
MPHLRPTAIAGLLLLIPAAGALSSCGFHYPTDRVNTISAGVNDRGGDMDALGIRVLASAKGQGRLIGALSNSTTDTASLDSISSSASIQADKFKPVEVAGRGTVNLADDSDVQLTGDFTAGDVIPLELSFSTGQTISLRVPVVKDCYQYTAVPTPTPQGGKSKSSESPSASTDGAAAEAGGSETGGDATFNCSDQAPTPGSGEH